MISSSANEIASFVPCPVSFLQNIHVYGAIHTMLFEWTGRTRGQCPSGRCITFLKKRTKKVMQTSPLEKCQILRLIGLGNLQRIHCSLSGDA